MLLRLEGGTYCIFSEIRMQYELPKLGLRKTKIKVWSCLNSLKMFNWRRLSLKNGWVSDLFPLDYIQVFSSKLTSDSSILLKKRVVLLCFVFARHENVAEGFLGGVTAGELLAYWLLPCIKLEMINMIRGKKVFMPLMLTLLKSVAAGEWYTRNIVLKVRQRRNCHQI